METAGVGWGIRLVWDLLNSENLRDPCAGGLSRTPEEDVGNQGSHEASAKTAHTFALLVHTFLFWMIDGEEKW